MIDIPTYWKMYVNPEVDLKINPSQPCPFHGEKHGKSFSYSASKQIFSCFGACHVIGGDVIDLHRLNYKIRSRKEAERSLNRLLGIPDEPTKIEFVDRSKVKVNVNEKEIEFKAVYGKALAIANNVELWLELDDIMSQYPPSIDSIRNFINRHS